MRVARIRRKLLLALLVMAVALAAFPRNARALGGEPAISEAYSAIVMDSEGNVLAGDVDSQIEGIVAHPKTIEKAFWNDPDVMNKKDANGEPLMEQRQGLLDRSKTIWALVNPNDYELVLQ